MQKSSKVDDKKKIANGSSPILAIPERRRVNAAIPCLLEKKWSVLTSESPMDTISAIRKGLPSSFVGHAAKLFELSPAVFSELTGITRVEKLQGSKNRRRLTTHESDIIYRIVRSLQRAETVLGSFESAIKWMKTPIRTLQRQRPISLMDTSAGYELVEQVLGNIEHGFVA